MPRPCRPTSACPTRPASDSSPATSAAVARREHDPFATGDDLNAKTFRVENLALTRGLTVVRLNDRRSLMRHLDKVPRTLDALDRFTTLDKFDADAYEFVSGKQARIAFDISRENEKLRDAYGRNSWGQLPWPPPRRSGSNVRHGASGRLGPSLEFEVGDGARPADGRLTPVELADGFDRRGLYDSTLVMLCGDSAARRE